jgi:predicted kinase
MRLHPAIKNGERKAFGRNIVPFRSPTLSTQIVSQVRDALFAPCDYSAAERDVSFAAMLDAARYHLNRDRVVIFDGMTFSRRSQVEAAESVAREAKGFRAIVVCDVPVEVAVARCEAGASAGAHLAANRDADLVRRVAEEMEEPVGSYLTLDMTADADELAGQALAYVLECAYEVGD